jgi:glyoxylase-like metal-dependent hydrolase (beta-lactamase superfamily II)
MVGLLAGIYACGLLKIEEKEISLYVIDCGTIKVKDISLFSPGVDQGISKTLTNTCYLIKHPNGNLLWDTGLPDDLGVDGVEKWDGAIHLSVKNPMLDQLAKINITPSDIDFVAVSHFHMDHSGNLNRFKQSALLLQKAEYDAAFGLTPEKFGYNALTYNALSKENVRIIKKDHDVFSDGSVIIKSAPGHTPGHQILVVNLPETGPVVLSGDLYHFTKNREFRRVPSFNFNKAQSVKSMDSVEKFIADTKATLWIQHDLEQNQTIKHAPYAYK